MDEPIDGLLFCEYRQKREELKLRDYGYNRVTQTEIKQLNNSWNITKLETNKTFNNIFFPEKELLIKRLDQFVTGQEFYAKIGIPHMFGVLLSGIPGSGKTSTIKAIAERLKMHILSVPLNKIKTASELVDIFTHPYINNKKIPMNKRMYIFEDIDCMSDVVMKRKSPDDEKKDNCEKTEKKKSDSSEKQTIIINNKDSLANFINSDVDELNLHTILNILDGLMEQPGRVVIMTTNFPELLDPALIRSGRVDMKINFDYVTTDTIHDMFEFYYKVSECKHEKYDSEFSELLKKIKTTELFNGTFSAADVISDIIMSLDDPFLCYESLVTKSKHILSNPIVPPKYRTVRKKTKQKKSKNNDDSESD